MNQLVFLFIKLELCSSAHCSHLVYVFLSTSQLHSVDSAWVRMLLSSTKLPAQRCSSLAARFRTSPAGLRCRTATISGTVWNLVVYLRPRLRSSSVNPPIASVVRL